MLCTDFNSLLIGCNNTSECDSITTYCIYNSCQMIFSRLTHIVSATHVAQVAYTRYVKSTYLKLHIQVMSNQLFVSSIYIFHNYMLCEWRSRKYDVMLHIQFDTIILHSRGKSSSVISGSNEDMTMRHKTTKLFDLYKTTSGLRSFAERARVIFPELTYNEVWHMWYAFDVAVGEYLSD